MEQSRNVWVGRVSATPGILIGWSPPTTELQNRIVQLLYFYFAVLDREHFNILLYLLEIQSILLIVLTLSVWLHLTMGKSYKNLEIGYLLYDFPIQMIQEQSAAYTAFSCL